MRFLLVICLALPSFFSSFWADCKIIINQDKPFPYEFSNVVFSEHGAFYLLDQRNKYLAKFGTSSARPLRVAKAPEPFVPADLTFLQDGRIAVANSSTSTIDLFDLELNFLTSLYTWNSEFTLARPMHLTSDYKGNIFVAGPAIENSRAFVQLDNTGVLVKTFISKDENFGYISKVEYGAGVVFLVEVRVDHEVQDIIPFFRIHIFQKDSGESTYLDVKKYGDQTYKYNVAIDRHNAFIYFVNTVTLDVDIFGLKANKILKSFKLSQRVIADRRRKSNVVIAPDGNIFIINGNNLFEFNTEGTYLRYYSFGKVSLKNSLVNLGMTIRQSCQRGI